MVFMIFTYMSSDSSGIKHEYQKPIFTDVSPSHIAHKPFFIKHPLAKDLQCDRFFGDGSMEYIQNLILPNAADRYVNKSRIIYGRYIKELNISMEDEDFMTDCESIRKRSYFPIKPKSEEEAKFRLAFARIVFMDYLFLEMELAASYAPQNFYCYMIDKKASQIFRDRIHNLTKCFPNVIVTRRAFDVDSFGHNITFSHVECLQALLKYEWRYVMLLQNHDSVAKTNYEIVQIFKWFNGANDVEILAPVADRINMTFDWTFEGLGLFRNAPKNLIGADGLEPQMNWAKGYVECSLSREMVEFMLLELNLTTFMYQLEANPFGIDEIMVPTLQVTDELNVPGGFTHACLDKGIDVAHITRKSIWELRSDPYRCPTKKFRHLICMFGIEDLDRLTKSTELFVNKIMPEFDFGAVICWYEKMFNRTYLEEPTAEKLDKNYYLSLPHVRFHHEKLKNNGNVDVQNFDCKTGNIYAKLNNFVEHFFSEE